LSASSSSKSLTPSAAPAQSRPVSSTIGAEPTSSDTPVGLDPFPNPTKRALERKRAGRLAGPRRASSFCLLL
jgi:hypothetical protein